MYIKLKVKAGAKRESIVQKKNDQFEIAVREEAARNMANRRVRELIALYFNVPLGKVRIVKGHTLPSKILSVNFDNKPSIILD